MIDTERLLGQLPNRQTLDFELDSHPTEEDIRTVVQQFKSDGLCGRRIAEDHLGPYFIASDTHGQREIELLDEVLEEEYANTDFCIQQRQSECSRLRGGCKGSR